MYSRYPVGRLLAICHPSVRCLSAICQPFVCHLLAICWPTVLLVNCRPSVGRWGVGEVSAECQWTVGEVILSFLPWNICLKLFVGIKIIDNFFPWFVLTKYWHRFNDTPLDKLAASRNLYTQSVHDVVNTLIEIFAPFSKFPNIAGAKNNF